MVLVMVITTAKVTTIFMFIHVYKSLKLTKRGHYHCAVKISLKNEVTDKYEYSAVRGTRTRVGSRASSALGGTRTGRSRASPPVWKA